MQQFQDYRTPPVTASPRRDFQIQVNMWFVFFPKRNFFAGVLKIYIANKNLLTQTEKLEHILPVLLKKRNQMQQESQERT